MKATIVILTTAAGMILALGVSSGTAQARNAQGAFLTNTNSIDPTAPVRVRVVKPPVQRPIRIAKPPAHEHDFCEFGMRRVCPDDPQCCGTIPRITYLGCSGCDSELRFGRGGRLDRTRIYRGASR